MFNLGKTGELMPKEIMKATVKASLLTGIKRVGRSENNIIK